MLELEYYWVLMGDIEIVVNLYINLIYNKEDMIVI